MFKILEKIKEYKEISAKGVKRVSKMWNVYAIELESVLFSGGSIRIFKNNCSLWINKNIVQKWYTFLKNTS